MVQNKSKSKWAKEPSKCCVGYGQSCLSKLLQIEICGRYFFFFSIHIYMYACMSLIFFFLLRYIFSPPLPIFIKYLYHGYYWWHDNITSTDVNNKFFSIKVLVLVNREIVIILIYNIHSTDKERDMTK